MKERGTPTLQGLSGTITGTTGLGMGRMRPMLSNRRWLRSPPACGVQTKCELSTTNEATGQQQKQQPASFFSDGSDTAYNDVLSTAESQAGPPTR